ncbi:APC family permease [Microbacterium sp. 179-B 1A2 NHS]|uniref:APC family permease n=1 Tax=Microbacterium sp. 179-B 1A2 NHS TaxID=3142383 RepID=UPI0039A00799
MSSPALQRRLGLRDAVFLGLGSMIGAGVFSAFGPAAAAAGGGVLLALAIAAIVGFCNATSTAQLAAVHPTSGGVYAYGRVELGPWWGFVAGWGFLIGKTASCAAMALTAAAYAAPPGWERPVAVAVVGLLTTVNLLGISRTALATRILVVVVLIVLGVAAVTVASGIDSTGAAAGAATAGTGDVYGTLQASGILFFAFAGYARIATPGEEVRDPARTIPRAIVLAFAGALSVYLIVGVVVLAALGPAGTAASSAPLLDAVRGADAPWAVPLVQLGAAAASLGALLALIAGIGRTAYAMARERDLPTVLDAVHPTRFVPHRAELTVAAVVVTLVLTVDLRGAIGFSSFGVLLYYAIANLAALRQRGAARRYPRSLQAVGLAGCAVLMATLPLASVVVGVAAVAVGVVVRAIGVVRRG